MSFAPDDTLTVKLTIAEWNLITGILGKQSYEMVAELIAKLREQAEQAHAQRMRSHAC